MINAQSELLPPLEPVHEPDTASTSHTEIHAHGEGSTAESGTFEPEGSLSHAPGLWHNGVWIPTRFITGMRIENGVSHPDDQAALKADVIAVIGGWDTFLHKNGGLPPIIEDKPPSTDESDPDKTILLSEARDSEETRWEPELDLGGISQVLKRLLRPKGHKRVVAGYNTLFPNHAFDSLRAGPDRWDPDEPVPTDAENREFFKERTRQALAEVANVQHTPDRTGWFRDDENDEANGSVTADTSIVDSAHRFEAKAQSQGTTPNHSDGAATRVDNVVSIVRQQEGDPKD